ncbi:hypothetical protein ACPEIF_22395 [Streptomyces sp. NPDC012600]|uniref:hypothetical protein n=1 Tax=unclassified Streptomyces TaxID=2593676 RepID=UPI0036CE1198
MTITLSATDVRTCESCWNAPVAATRRTPVGRDLLCAGCTAADYPRRVDLFPPFGIYRLTGRRIEQGRQGSVPPQMSPDPRPATPHPRPTPSPPGTSPV